MLKFINRTLAQLNRVSLPLLSAAPGHVGSADLWLNQYQMARRPLRVPAAFRLLS